MSPQGSADEPTSSADDAWTGRGPMACVQCGRGMWPMAQYVLCCVCVKEAFHERVRTLRPLKTNRLCAFPKIAEGAPTSGNVVGVFGLWTGRAGAGWKGKGNRRPNKGLCVNLRKPSRRPVELFSNQLAVPTTNALDADLSTKPWSHGPYRSRPGGWWGATCARHGPRKMGMLNPDRRVICGTIVRTWHC
jgi:hypothetical protein